MRYLEVVGAAIVAATVAASPAIADRYRPADYAPPFTPAWAAPQLGVEPQVGRPGTQVHIFGAKFHAGLQVFFGDHPMPIVAANKREIIAMVPWNAHGQDFIYVTDNTGRARTSFPFAVERRHDGHYHRW
jgi:hypothetical protein